MHPKKIYDICNQYMQSNFFSAIRSLFGTRRKGVCHGNPLRQSQVNSVLFLSCQSDVAIFSSLRVALICLLMCLGVGSAWGTKSYKLTAVTSVSAGNKYVFVQGGYALSNTIVSSSLTASNSYSTSNLSGNEAYVWTLETAINGFLLKNLSLNANPYLRNSDSNGTGVGFGGSGAERSVWSFAFIDGKATISCSVNNRKLANDGNNVYKAYASPSKEYRSFTVYRLDEEVSVHHVAIEGRWDRFGGETISLTATAYASEGNDSLIDAADINSFQWQKYYNSTWNDIDTEANPSAATPNLVIENCSSENSGSYRCVASTNPTPSVASDELQVKVFTLECYTGGTTVYNFTRVGETQAGILQIDLAANTSYQFKFHADVDYYGNSGTINEDVSNWVCSTSQGNLTIASGLGGTFTIEMEYSSGGSSSVEGEPEISVTYPRKTIFLQPNSDWKTNSAKFALYYFRKEGETTYISGWTDFMTQFPCSIDYYMATIPQWNGVQIIAVRLNSSTVTPGNWNDKWNQTADITITSNDLVTITGWDSHAYNSSFSVPTYSISFAGGSGSSGSMGAIDEIACDAEQELPACGFSKTGYDFANWTADVAVVVEAATITAGDAINDAVMLQNIRSNISLTAVWNPITYNLTYEGLEGATNSNPASYTIETTTISLANPGSRTGYTFTGWTCGGEAITEIPLGSTGDKTITANWTHDNYSVTWNVNGASYSAGVDSYNDNAYYGDKISKMPTPPADNTLVSCANKFMGWSTTEIGSTPVTDAGEIAALGLFTDVEGSPAITGNTTFYAVFAEQSSPDANTVIWSEDFSGYESQNIPSGSVTTATGRVVYNEGYVTYSCANGVGDENDNTRVLKNNLAGGALPELLVGYGKSTPGYFHIADISNAGAAELTLIFKKNDYALTPTINTGDETDYGLAKVSGSGAGTYEYTVTCGSASTFSLRFTGNVSSNVRLDDIVLKIKTPGYTNYVTQCAPEPQITISGDIHLTSVKDVYVYATSAADNLLQIQSDDLAGVTKLDIKYLDADNGDAEVERTSSIFRLCNNGTENYNEADDTQIDVSAADTYSQTFSIKFTPTTYNQYYHYKLQITMKRGLQVVKTVTHDLYGRSLPEEFVVASKSNSGIWYALPNNLASTQDGQTAITPIRISVDNISAPTVAAYAPNEVIYRGTGRNAPTSNINGVRFTTDNSHWLQTSSTSVNQMWLSATNSDADQVWYLKSTDFGAYIMQMDPSHSPTKKMGMYGSNMGYYANPTSPSEQIYLLPVATKYTLREATVTEWGRNSVVMAVSASDASGAKAHVENGDITETQTITPINETAAKAKNFRVPVGSIDLADLAASEGKLLYIDWLDGGGEVIATSCVMIPRIIAESRDMHRTGETTKTPWNTEVHVLPGVTLTANTASYSPSGAKISDLHIYPGATLNITTDTLNANNLSLHNGWTYAGARRYDVARVYINDDAALTKTTAAMYLNSYDQTEGRHYYPLAVPFETAVSSIDYADASLASFSTYGTHYVIKGYNGANRAEYGEDNNNWAVVSDVSDLIPGKGYIVTAVAVKGEALLKIPLNFNDAWTADGEKGSATYDEAPHTKNAIAVTAYSGSAATAQPRHAGWNMLGVPYMSCFHTEELPYVSIPSHDFAEYIQIDGAETDLRPGWSFFVQVGADGNMTFSEAGRRTNEVSPIYAPQRTTDSDIVKTGIILTTADGESADKLGLIISDSYTAAYEVGADLEKMFGNGYTLATYSLSGATRLAFNALSRAEAAQVIPVGFRAPETGSYTFAINPRYTTAGLLRLELIDYQTQEVTDLMTDTYTFTTPRTQDDSRFAIHMAFTDPGSPTPAEVTPSATEQPHALTRKFVKDGCLFIQRGNRIYDATGKEVCL